MGVLCLVTWCVAISDRIFFLVFHAYINEMHGSRSKIPSKNIVRQHCAEGFNFGVKGLITSCQDGMALSQRVPEHGTLLRQHCVSLPHSLQLSLQRRFSFKKKISTLLVS
jgi:hypothetical protein